MASATALALTLVRPSATASSGIQLQRHPHPILGPGQVLVVLLAAPVNPLDLAVISGSYPIKPRHHLSEQPILGFDGVARVTQIGSAVTDQNIAVGDLIVPRALGLGTWRTHAVLSPHELRQIPACTDVHFAAILRTVVLPAYFLVEDMRRLRPGDWILLNAGTGAIPRLVSQFARLRGVRCISVFRSRTSAAENQRTADNLRAYGADVALPDTWLDQDGVFDDKRIVLALDAVWGASAERLVAHMANGGLFVNYGVLGGPALTSIAHSSVFSRAITIKSFRSTQSIAARSEAEIDDLLAWIIDLSNKGLLAAPDLDVVAWRGGDAVETILKETFARVQSGEIGAKKPEAADHVSQYCEEHSTELPERLAEHWAWTSQSFGDADKMSSKLQGQWMIFTAQDRKPKRILEIGCYSGYSALAWYEGTRDTGAEIITLELSQVMIDASRATFDKHQVTDRVKLLEGPASESIEALTGTFDLVFVDANKDGYEGYVKQILDKKLLSEHGIILCDNVFARGLTVGKDVSPNLSNAVRPYWTACGKALAKFNDYVFENEQVDVAVLPLFDGISQIKWKAGAFSAKQTNGH
ncbi:putative secondary metabolism biosynthetic enzyme [Neofusicoccum ribis]|uniref:enoyl-[acyl-carrier-protein] reductase n=1 Tax=Neofusicoccum ribis TaxID=45134 RepID=A0ABR3SAI5_9PEZI